MPNIRSPVPLYAVPEIENIFFNEEHTTIVWADGKKTTVGCSPDDTFDEYAGFAAAVIKKMFGTSRDARVFLDEHKIVQKASQDTWPPFAWRHINAELEETV